MKVEIISTGTELLLGEIIDTNAKFLANRLNELGFDVFYQTTIGDNYARMQQVLQEASKRADIIITSGGLGPTQGDITKEVTAEFLKRKLIIDKDIEKKLREFFISRNVKMPENNCKQALVPENSIVLNNDKGTAPGIWVEDNDKIFINLPGPPKELQNMFEKQVVPLLIEKFGMQGIIYSRTLKCFGIGESTIAEKLYDLIKNQSNPSIALYARDGEILIRLTAKAETKEQADKLIDKLATEFFERIPEIYGENADTLSSNLGILLRKKNLTISLAESCTSGLTSSLLTDTSGSSSYFLGSVVTYSNEAKINLINVDKNTLIAVGAVSHEVAEQMAEGVKNKFATDIGIGITGIAGPDGGTEEKPVGTVYIAIALKNNTTVYKHLFSGERTDIKLRSAKMALFHTLQLIK